MTRLIPPSATRTGAVAGLLAAALVVGAVSPARAQRVGDVSVTVKVAVDPSIGGVTHLGRTGTIDGTGLTVTEQTWDETHSRQAPLFNAGVGVRVAALADVVGNVEYGRVGSDPVEIGSVDGQRLLASFERYQFWGTSRCRTVLRF